MIPNRIAALLGAARMAIGVSVWAAPGPSIRTLGFDPGDGGVRTLARLAGTRDLALGGAALACADDAEAAATITRLNAAVDALDAVAFLALAHRPGHRRAALLGTSTAVFATVAGLALASQLDRQA